MNTEALKDIVDFIKVFRESYYGCKGTIWMI